jgi:hypothetical protein
MQTLPCLSALILAPSRKAHSSLVVWEAMHLLVDEGAHYPECAAQSAIHESASGASLFLQAPAAPEHAARDARESISSGCVYIRLQRARQFALCRQEAGREWEYYKVKPCLQARRLANEQSSAESEKFSSCRHKLNG